MSTLVLGLGGAVAGAALGPLAFGAAPLLWGTVSSAALGSTIGGSLGSYLGGMIDTRLFAKSATTRATRRDDIPITRASEGTGIGRHYGVYRISGLVIWATNFNEVITSEKVGGGKGFGAPSQRVEKATYFASFAQAFGEGSPRHRLGRMYADGKVLDTSNIVYRFYAGTEDQLPDPIISANQGAGNAPAYRGTCYVVFENLDLTRFGNRVPQITAEIFAPAYDDAEDVPENLVSAVNITPATGEAVYATTLTVNQTSEGESTNVNVNRSKSESDFTVSMADLTGTVQNLAEANLVVAWFGTDLRAGECEVWPGVESRFRTLRPTEWSVGGDTRATAYLISQTSGSPTYGGTPADWCVFEGIRHLIQRGVAVNFYPFLLMDIPAGNGKLDPYGGAEQSAHPWRGRITSLANGTAGVQAEIDSLFGSAQAGDFSVIGGNYPSVTYTGAASDRGIRRMILHYAHLTAEIAKASGNPTLLRRFYVGSEMVGLTRLRSNVLGVYPAVEAFRQLILDVKAIFASRGVSFIKVSYAADWSEYHSHRPADGSGDVFFNMDRIWPGAGPADFVAIDWYPPLTDWRDGISHLDYGSGVDAYGRARATNPYDPAYLRARIEGGPDYDWFYATEGDRIAQIRTPILDEAHGEHWVFRQKDLRNWLSQPHRNRPGGVRSASPTAFNPAAEVVLSAIGCPAVDKGANQPNVFYDPKSSESAVPYFSSGIRDDAIQRAFITAYETYFRSVAPIATMTSRAWWSWDARPYPAFPLYSAVWSDAKNYQLGHWLNGRLGSNGLAYVIRAECRLAGYADNQIDTTNLIGSWTTVRGYAIESGASIREALEPLSVIHHFDIVETAGTLKFITRGIAPVQQVDMTKVVLTGDDPIRLERAPEYEIPEKFSVTYTDESNAFQPRTVVAESQSAKGKGAVATRFSAVLTQAQAETIVTMMAEEARAERESLVLPLSIGSLSHEPGDVLQVTFGNRDFVGRVESVTIGSYLNLSLVASCPCTYDAPQVFIPRVQGNNSIVVAGPPILRAMNLPLVADEPFPASPRLATYQTPFPAGVNVYLDSGEEAVLLNQLSVPTKMGVTTTALSSGPTGVIDERATVTVRMFGGEQLTSTTLSKFLSYYNRAALRHNDGQWEILSYRDAVLSGERAFTLSGFLRGQSGTEFLAEETISEGADIVFFPDQGAFQALSIASEIARTPLALLYGPANTDPAGDFYQATTLTGQAVGMRPLAPSQPRLVRLGTDLLISWVKRTRFNGEDFDAADVPLNETSERYTLRILSAPAGTVLREVAGLSAPSYTYTTAMQIADFGSTQLSLSIELVQVSTEYGEGTPLQAEIKLGRFA